MGQYWIPVNLDKREFVHPHRLGSGLKLWEQLAAHPGTSAALIILCAAMPERRGGGDLDLNSNWHGPERKDVRTEGPIIEDYQAIAARTIGRWAGDRIALVGDYAESTDLGREHKAKSIYGKCLGAEDKQEYKRQLDAKEITAKQYEKALEGAFVDVTDDVCAVIEHELGGKFWGDGWREFVRGAE